MVQSSDLGRRQRLVPATPKASRQLERSIADPDQATDLVADRFPESSDLSVTPLPQGHIEPAIGPIATGMFDRLKMCRPIGQPDPRLQLLKFCSRRIAVNPNRVLANNFGLGMHQRVGQCPVSREQE